MEQALTHSHYMTNMSAVIIEFLTFFIHSSLRLTFMLTGAQARSDWASSARSARG